MYNLNTGIMNNTEKLSKSASLPLGGTKENYRDNARIHACLPLDPARVLHDGHDHEHCNANVKQVNVPPPDKCLGKPCNGFIGHKDQEPPLLIFMHVRPTHSHMISSISAAANVTYNILTCAFSRTLNNKVTNTTC